MVKCSFVFGLIGSALLCAQMALGYELQSNWTYTPAVGLTLFENGGLKDGQIFSLGAGLELDKRWAVEGALSYINTEADKHGDPSQDIFQATVSARYDLVSADKLIPYVLAGAGGFYADSNMFGTTSGVSLHAGGGVRYLLSSDVALKGEIRQQTFFGMLDAEGDRKNCSDLTALVGMEFRFPMTRTVTVAPVSVAEVATAVAPALEPEPAEAFNLIKPRFNAGEDKIVRWGKGDMAKMTKLVEEKPSAKILVLCDVDEKYLTLGEFNLQKLRALYLRYFLIGHFSLDPNAVQVVTHQNLSRFSKDELDRYILIRFIPVENPPNMSQVQDLTAEEAG